MINTDEEVEVFNINNIKLKGRGLIEKYDKDEDGMLNQEEFKAIFDDFKLSGYNPDDI